jgi:hypothetical protein
MSTLSLRLPESLHKRLADLAAREGISINQLIASAVAEKMAALDTAEMLGARAARGSRRSFLAALAKVPDVAADAGDELPAAARLRKPAARRSSKKTG